MLLKYLATMILLMQPFVAASQMTEASRIYGEHDQDIAVPVHSTKTSSDSTAIQMLITFMQSSGLTGWRGMTANGSITFANETISHPATLSLLGGSKSRLDVKLDSGTQSTIFNGTRGVFLDAAGGRFAISSDIATSGLLAFPRFLAAGYPTGLSIMTDRGTTSIGGPARRRITLDDPASDGTGNPWKTVDLYFDLSSGQLAESVTPVHLSTSDPSLYMLETFYTNYKALNSGGAAVAPLTISQSLNGQLQWTLALSDANTAILPVSSSFDF